MGNKQFEAQYKTIDDLHQIDAENNAISALLATLLRDKDMWDLPDDGYVMCWGFWTDSVTGTEYIVARYWDYGEQDNYLLKPEWLFMPIGDVRVAYKEREEKLKRGER